jgi:hypothetical protein
MSQNNPINKFAHFDSSNFPQIHVHFQSTINHIDEYNQFEKDWLECYQQNKHFYFIFDISNVGYVNPIYAYYLTLFIQDLKVRNLKLLDFSIIIVHNWYIKQLLNGIFEIQKPVSTVYIVEKTNLQLNELIQDIHSNNVKDKIDKINKIIIKK